MVYCWVIHTQESLVTRHSLHALHSPKCSDQTIQQMRLSNASVTVKMQIPDTSVVRNDRSLSLRHLRDYRSANGAAPSMHDPCQGCGDQRDNSDQGKRILQRNGSLVFNSIGVGVYNIISSKFDCPTREVNKFHDRLEFRRSSESSSLKCFKFS